MAEYIEREAAKRAVYNTLTLEYEAVYNEIDNCPAADVVEVVRKPVVGYEGYYEVDQFGRVFSVDRVISVDDNGRKYDKPLNGKQMKQGMHDKGYKIVSLTKDGKTKMRFVHRLVAEAFIPNPDNLPMVNHKDEDKTNNFLENLEWCTNEYNLSYGTAKERRAKKLRGVPHTENHNQKISSSMKRYYEEHKSTAKGRREENGKKVVRVDDCGNEMVFETIRDAALYVNGHPQNIASCCNGKRKTAYGFKWKFCSYGERRERLALEDVVDLDKQTKENNAAMRRVIDFITEG